MSGLIDQPIPDVGIAEAIGAHRARKLVGFADPIFMNSIKFKLLCGNVEFLSDLMLVDDVELKYKLWALRALGYDALADWIFDTKTLTIKIKFR